MELTKKEEYEIAQMVANILDKRARKRINRSWITLRKEIRNYCESNNGIVRWSTLQNKIYDAIRACLDVSRLDDMTDDQVLRAEKIFRFIKQERQENK